MNYAIKLVSGVVLVAIFVFAGYEAWYRSRQPEPVIISYDEPAAYPGWPIIYEMQANGTRLYSPSAAISGAQNMPPSTGSVYSGVVLPGLTDQPEYTVDWQFSWVEWKTKQAYRIAFSVAPEDFPKGSSPEQRLFHYFRFGQHGEFSVYSSDADGPMLIFQGCGEPEPDLAQPGTVLGDALAEKHGLAYGSGPKKGQLLERVKERLNDPVPDGACKPST
ncbi:hypothetical protein [Thalassospira sp. TSL5-1]|uniref:hypothetical protein n=1 Tax=Thalassospira sp. TSL5-1 TaxID=1544451 RepID=UPI00093D08F9|nr:hypothetical protein [Thalassospira sp. TSL5-1]OKH87650.1 hypothetical protein LF95_12890 [Thalassospira sp. TSL5-1]